MRLEYYLCCRKEYEDIINYLNEIIKKYEIISDVTATECNLEGYYEIFQPEHNKNFFIDKLNHISQLKKICDRKVIELCEHEFIKDVIDIDPERSQTIIYCKICEYTKPN